MSMILDVPRCLTRVAVEAPGRSRSGAHVVISNIFGSVDGGRARRVR
jgi:hypothetical protein